MKKLLHNANSKLTVLHESQIRTEFEKNAVQQKLLHNISTLERSLSQSNQELKSSLINMQTLATQLEIVRKNCSSHHDILRMQLNSSNNQLQDLQIENRIEKLRAEQNFKTLEQSQKQEALKLKEQIGMMQQAIESVHMLKKVSSSNTGVWPTSYEETLLMNTRYIFHSFYI